MYFFYIARCADGALYVGSCNDLMAREKRHNEGKGAIYTHFRRPIRIIYHEEFSTLVEARRREAQIKPWNRMKKENLAQGKHPTKGHALS
jgi:putative endonuclease